MIEINGTDIDPPKWNDLEREMLLNLYTMMGLPAMMGTDVEVTWKRLNQTAFILDIKQPFLDEWKADCIKVHGEERGGEIYLQELDAVVRETTRHLWQDLNAPRADQGDEDEDDEEKSTVDKLIDQERKPEKWAISLTLTKCPYPDIKINGQQYYAAKDAWKNMTFYEFGMVWEYINAYMRTSEDTYMNSVLAILYRPSKDATEENIRSGYEGDQRQPVRKHESMIPERAAAWAAMPNMVQNILMFWAICCRQHIYMQYIDVFGEPEHAEDEGDNYRQEAVNSGFPEMIMELAGNIVDVDRVADQNVHNVLMYIRKRKEDVDKREAARAASK
mgnify:CR=1 FL=1